MSLINNCYISDQNKIPTINNDYRQRKKFSAIYNCYSFTPKR